MPKDTGTKKLSIIRLAQPRNTPVHIACEIDETVDVLRILVREFGANPRAKNNVCCQHAAPHTLYASFTIKRLCDYSFQHRLTPLHIAALHGNLIIVKALVEELGAREDLYAKDIVRGIDVTVFD